MKLKNIIEQIKDLPITHKPVNHWEDIHYKPYTKKLVDLDKVLEILEYYERRT